MEKGYTKIRQQTGDAPNQFNYGIALSVLLLGVNKLFRRSWKKEGKNILYVERDCTGTFNDIEQHRSNGTHGDWSPSEDDINATDWMIYQEDYKQGQDNPANFKMPKDKPDEVDLPSDVQSEMPEHAFERELCALINKYSLEETSNIPDFLLAEYLARSLTTFNHLTIKRTDFYKPPT